MSAINAVPVQVAGTPSAPVTVTNTGATNIYIDHDNGVSLAKHQGHLPPGASFTVSDTIWLATDGTAGAYTASQATGDTELGRAEITANAALAAAMSDIPGLSVTVTVGSRPIKVIFDAQSGQISAAGNFNGIQIMEGATQLAVIQFGVGAANGIYPLHRERTLAPTPGLHTYKIQGGVSGSVGANDRIVASVASPASLQVVQL